jgi:hypothetical protein
MGAVAGVEAEASLDVAVAGDAVFPEVLGEDEVGAGTALCSLAGGAGGGGGGRCREGVGGGEDAAVGADEGA